MPEFLYNGALQTLKLMTQRMLNYVWDQVYTFIRRRLIAIRMFSLGVPYEKGIWKGHADTLYENSATKALRVLFSSRRPGATVYWGLESLGKSYMISKLSKEYSTANGYRFIYIDCTEFNSMDFKSFLYNKIGMDRQSDQGPFSSYLPNDTGYFITVVLNRFDVAMMKSDAACAVVSEMTRDSIRTSCVFNLLIVVNSPTNALSLLTIAKNLPRQHIKLLGPAFCGRWGAEELPISAKTCDMLLVNQCGTLMPLICDAANDPLIQLRASQQQLEWEHGERMLEAYRESDEIV